MALFSTRFFYPLVVALSVVILDSVARAEGAVPTPGQQQLRTADGEMFVGELISQNAEVIRFRSVLAGELIVPARGAMLSRRDPATAEPAAQTPGWVKTATAPDLAAGGGAKPAGTSATVVAPAVAAPKHSPWKFGLEGGLSYQDAAVGTRNIYALGEVMRETQTSKYRLFGKYLYGEQASVKNTDKVAAGAGMRHVLAERWQFRGDGTYANDRLRDLDAEYTAMGGFFYKLFKSSLVELDAGPGAGLRYRETTLGMLEGMRWNYDFQLELKVVLTDRINFTSNGAILYDSDAPDAFRLKNTTALTIRLTEYLYGGLRYEYELDHASARTVNPVEQRYFTTLGVKF